LRGPSTTATFKFGLPQVRGRKLARCSAPHN
jgi:hypothetical protein